MKILIKKKSMIWREDIAKNQSLLKNVLKLENETFKSVDFSGQVLEEYFSSNCHFFRCKFENMNVKRACLGFKKKSNYIDCSFDRSSFIGFSRENAKFINCSFLNISLYDFTFNECEFINCVFSGKLNRIIFYHTPYADNDDVINKFETNDFSEATFTDVEFKGGVDLSKQKLPLFENYIYIKDGKKFIVDLKDELFHLNKTLKIAVILWIERYEEDLKRGQEQFFLKIDELSENYSVLRDMGNLYKKILSRY